MIFHENRLLADDSHEISSFIIFFRKSGNMSKNVSSAAVLIGALRVPRSDIAKAVDTLLR